MDSKPTVPQATSAESTSSCPFESVFVKSPETLCFYNCKIFLKRMKNPSIFFLCKISLIFVTIKINEK